MNSDIRAGICAGSLFLISASDGGGGSDGSGSTSTSNRVTVRSGRSYDNLIRYYRTQQNVVRRSFLYGFEKPYLVSEA